MEHICINGPNEMISFIGALYNEESEIVDLLNHVEPYVDAIYLADDGSTDLTKLLVFSYPKIDKISLTPMKHTGLPETVKNEALSHVPDGSWVIMLDADERFRTPLPEIIEWIKSPASNEVDYVYFTQHEIIDDRHVRTFQKSKLFRKGSITFSTGIHEDDRFEGRGWASDWIVNHRKSTYKQIERETQYLETYKRLLVEGKIDEGRYKWLVGLHHYVKS